MGAFSIGRKTIVNNPDLADAILNGDVIASFHVALDKVVFTDAGGNLLSVEEVEAALEKAEKEGGEENYQHDWGGF